MNASPDAPPSPAPQAGASPSRVARRTRGVCSDCLQEVDAELVSEPGAAWLVKTCPVHGETRQLLSRSPEHWLDLDRFFFQVNPEAWPQRDYMVRLTERCNLDCPICLAKANTEDTPDLDLSHLARFLSERRGIKIDLLAAEPTLREDLEEQVRLVKSSGNIAALHTNGLKLADLDYARRMKDCGVDEVFLQFDGFDDDAHEVLRGARLTKRRLQAVDNLREVGLATSLIVVIGRGLNEAQVGEVYRFALRPENRHIREVFFLGLRLLGSARDALLRGRPDLANAAMMPDEIVDLLTAQVPEISRADIRRFNKLYFSLLSAFQVRKCLYVQHYMVARDDDGGSRPVAALMDLAAIERACERYAKGYGRSRRLARVAFLADLARLGVTRQTLPMLYDLARLQLLFKSGMNLGDVPRRFLLLGFITACDPANYDSDVARSCGKGELSADGGLIDSGADANVLREARLQGSGKVPGSGRRFRRGKA